MPHPRPRVVLAAAVTATLAVGAGSLSAGAATVFTDAGPARTGAATAGPGAPAGPPPTAAPAAGAPSSKHTVTLVTGDVVTVTTAADGRTSADVQPAPGSTGGVHTQTVGRSLYVVPDSAVPFLAAGALDRGLFDVTGLIAQGYDDAHVDSVPLIAQYATPSTARRSNPAPTGSTRTRALESIGADALRADKTTVRTFWRGLAGPVTRAAGPTGSLSRLGGKGTNRLTATAPAFAGGVTKLWLDRRVHTTLAETNAQIGAPAAWARGATGTGVRVAVLDTGFDATHPDLAGQVEESKSFVPGQGMADVDGHGTHTASTVAGTGAASGGAEKAVAHDARLVVGKVLDDAGQGAESWIIDGMEWASEQAPIVSMSLGTESPSDGRSPMDQAVDELTAARGTLFVVAAGNTGSVGIGAPGAADAALTVGSVGPTDERSWFSSTGPRSDGALKPDLVAPGADVLAARSAQSAEGEGPYLRLSGTSMATPQVAGAAALLLQQHPRWKAPQLKAALTSRSAPLAGVSPFEVGAGRLDVPAATFPDVIATGTLSFGTASFPHDDDRPVTRTVTYTNVTDSPVTLDLAATATAADGSAAPTGLFTVSADRVTVPAAGTAEVGMTADPARGAAGATYAGTLTASVAGGGAVAARSVFGLVVEGERYDLSITATGRDGRPAGTFASVYRYGDQYSSYVPVDGKTTMRVEPGIYTVTTWMPVAGDGGRDSAGVALLGTPRLVVDGAKTVRLDARTATEVDAVTPRASVDSVRRVSWFHDSGIGGPYAAFGDDYGVTPDVDDVYAAPTTTVAAGEYAMSTRWRRTAPLLELRTAGQDGVELHPLAIGGAPRLDGRINVRGVDAGLGRPRDLVDLPLQGQAAVITRSDTVDPSAAAKAAAKAGAALLVVVNDRPGRLWTVVDATLPVVSLTQAEGAGVLRAAKAGTLRLTAKGTSNTPYLYDLVDHHEGRIPASLVYRPTAADLATVQQRFVGATPTRAVERRFDCATWFWPPCIAASEPVTVPSTRTDYVTAGTDWYQDVQTYSGIEQRAVRGTFARGEKTTTSWLGPVTRPRTGDGFWGPYRQGDFMALNVPPASTGDAGVTGTYWDDTSATVVSRLYAGDTLVDETPFQAVQTDVPPTSRPTTYRFEQDTTRSARTWTYSTRTHTAWTFRSQHVAEDTQVPQPLLQLDYGVPTDLTGRVARDRATTLTLSPSQVPGVAATGSVKAATLALSFDDGRLWQQVPLTRRGDTWTARMVVPTDAGSFVSLRASARDAAGNAVTQRVIRAFGLR